MKNLFFGGLICIFVGAYLYAHSPNDLTLMQFFGTMLIFSGMVLLVIFVILKNF